MPTQEEIMSRPGFRSLSPKDQEEILSTFAIEPGAAETSLVAKGRRKLTNRDIANTGIDLIRPIVSGAAGTAAAAYTGPGAVVAAPLAYTATDTALQALKPDGNSPGVASLIDTGMNAAGGHLIGKIPVVAKTAATAFGEKFLNKAVPVEAAIDANKTFAQRLKPGLGQTLSSWMEDVFAPGAKMAQNAKTMQAGIDEMSAAAFAASGRNPLLNPKMQSPKPEGYAMRGIDKLKTTVERIQTGIGELAEVPKMIARRNPSGLNPANMPNLSLGGLPQLDALEGPTMFLGAANEAQKFLKSMEGQMVGGPQSIPDKLKGPINIAQQLLTDLKAKVGPNGDIISVQPIGFAQAWKRKVDLGNQTFVPGGEKKLSAVYKAMNQDMEDSISKWPIDPGKSALKGFQNARALSALSYNHFLDSEMAPTMNALVNHNEGSAIPLIDDVLDDAFKLRKIISSSRVPIPTPKGQIVIEDQNMKGFFAGRMLDKVRRNLAEGKIGSALDVWGKEGKQEVKDQLFTPAEQSNVNQLFKGMDEASKKNAGSTVGLIMKATRAGFMIPAASLATGVFTNYTALSGATGGLMLSGTALAHIMTNPKLARYMISLGEAGPLGASGSFVGRQIRSAIKNAPVGIISAGGDVQWGQLDKDGNWKARD